MAKILITGASSGLGESLALLAAKEGHQVIACGRNKQKLDQLCINENISSCVFDVTDNKSTRQALQGINCDIAVLNAGTCEYVDVDKLDPEMFKRVFETNVFGVVNVISALLPRLTSGNKIVMVDSLARLLPFTKSQAYGASKSALNYIAKTLEVDLASSGITVQTISPGFVETPLTDKNDFPMPMCITSAKAARYMLDGIFKNKSSVYFPRRFSAMIRVMNLLPEFIQKRLCISMRTSASEMSKPSVDVEVSNGQKQKCNEENEKQ